MGVPNLLVSSHIPMMNSPPYKARKIVKKFTKPCKLSSIELIGSPPSSMLAIVVPVYRKSARYSLIGKSSAFLGTRNLALPMLFQ